MTTDLYQTNSTDLRVLADGLKADAKALSNHNREEAMRLFRLYRVIVTELHRRRNPSSTIRGASAIRSRDERGRLCAGWAKANIVAHVAHWRAPCPLGQRERHVPVRRDTGQRGGRLRNGSCPGHIRIFCH